MSWSFQVGLVMVLTLMHSKRCCDMVWHIELHPRSGIKRQAQS